MKNNVFFEKRKYTRLEMGEIFGLDIKDKNFKRKVETRLANLGFTEEDYIYTRNDVTILWIPITREEKIGYLVRLLDIDTRVDPKAFATFVYVMLEPEYEEYQCMPWEARVELFNDTWGYDLSVATYKRWMAKLIAMGAMFKDDAETEVWCTCYINGSKERFPLEGEAQEQVYECYKARKSALIDEYKDLDKKEKWEKVFSGLWAEFHCVYYRCGKFRGTAWANNDLIQELMELVSGYKEELT